MRPAIVLLEFDSIAVGIRAGDAMAKRAPLETLHAGSVQPGKYLVLAGGPVGDVEEARSAGREAGAAALVDEIFLPDVHTDVVQALSGGRRPAEGEALGIVETRTAAAVIGAADAGVKGALVRLLEVRLADGLGGKGYALFSGEVSAVEAAVELGVASLPATDLLVQRVVIPRLHGEMLENLIAHPEFGSRVRSYRTEE
jgi:microcompartment protein CcmL/EutN